MKIYNIKNTRELFETLSKCEGNVELVNNEGEHMDLCGKDCRNLKLLSETYVDGTINEMELCFSKKEDAFKVFEFLSGLHNVA